MANGPSSIQPSTNTPFRADAVHIENPKPKVRTQTDDGAGAEAVVLPRPRTPSWIRELLRVNAQDVKAVLTAFAVFLGAGLLILLAPAQATDYTLYEDILKANLSTQELCAVNFVNQSFISTNNYTGYYLTWKEGTSATGPNGMTFKVWDNNGTLLSLCETLTYGNSGAFRNVSCASGFGVTAGRALNVSMNASGITCVYGNNTNVYSGGRLKREDSEWPSGDMYLQIWGVTPPPPAVAILSRLSQSPANVTSTNLYTQDLNISYNITDTSGPLFNVYLSYKSNNTAEAPIRYVNGTAISATWLNHSGTNNTAINYWNFSLMHEEVYPATGNIDEETIQVTPHLGLTLASGANLTKTKLFNVSSTKPSGFYEFMANNATTGTALRVYYCNSTYTSGPVQTSPNCVQFCSVASTQAYNVTHSAYSSHFLCPFTLANGAISGVKVNDGIGYFLLRGAGGGVNWNVSYISSVTRPDQVQLSGDSGNTWTNLSGTTDQYLRQYSSNDTLYYYAVANYTNGTILADTTIYSDIFESDILPPTAPDVAPHNYTEYVGDNITLNVTWTASNSTGTYIGAYNLTLWYADNNTLAHTINHSVLNTTPYFNWNSTNISGGHYFFRVVANNSYGLTAFGESEDFYFLRWSPPTYTFNVSANSIQTISAFSGAPSTVIPYFNLVYDGTSKNNSFSFASSGWTATNSSRVPAPTGFNDTYLFYWYGTVQLTNGTNVTYQGLNWAQYVYKPILGNCTGPATLVALNLTHINEESLGTLVASTHEINLTYQSGAFSGGYNETLTGAEYYEICLYPSFASFTMNATSLYSASGYSTRFYFIRNAQVNNATNGNLTYYVLPSSLATNVTFVTQSNDGATPAGILVIFQRWFPGLNSYLSVQQIETSGLGTDKASLRSLDVYYKVIVIKDGTQVLVKEPWYGSGTVTFTYIESAAGAYWNKIGKLTGRCVTTNVTGGSFGSVNCTVSDITGLSNTYTFSVVQLFAVTNVSVCGPTTSTTPSVSFTCNLGNTTGNEYYYSLIAQSGSDRYDLDSGTVSGSRSLPFGGVGPFLAFFLVMFAFSFAGKSIPNAMAYGLIALVASWSMQLIGGPIGAYVSLGIVVFILLWRIRGSRG